MVKEASRVNTTYLTVDFVPSNMAKTHVELQRAIPESEKDLCTAPTTNADEDFTDSILEEHSKEGSYVESSDDEAEDEVSDSLGLRLGSEINVTDCNVDESEDQTDFLKSMKPLGRISGGNLNRSRSTSILKSSSPDLYINDSRRSWKSLPKPDMLRIRSQSLPTTRSEREVSQRKSVKFNKIEVRNYSQTLGDNPSCSYGPPISLDWKYEEGGTLELEDYEANRGPRRKLRHMMLNYYHRKNILQYNVGCTDEEILEAQKLAEKIKSQRALTRALLPASKLEDVMQSAARKARRAFKKDKNRSS